MERIPGTWMEAPLRVAAHAPVTTGLQSTLHETALVMEQKRATAVLVQSKTGLLEGIFTLKDLRKALANDPGAGKGPVREWMSSPVRTFPKDLGMASAQIAMLRHRISHLVLTEDGTTESEVVGMIEQRDILITQSHNPGLLVRKIKKAPDLESLLYITEETENLIEEYLNSGIPLPYLARIKAALTDAIIVRILERRLAMQPELANHKFSWMALGSLGREEQLLRTDQDNALIFADTDEESTKELKTAFLKLAEGVNRDLDHLGYTYCPADMMAQNPEWCLPLSAWKEKFRQWIHQSDDQGIMHSCIFFDYRPLYGDMELVSLLDHHLQQELQSASLFLGYMAVNTLKSPKVFDLLGRYLRETQGEFRGRFDLKSRGMMPLADAARTLCLSRAHLRPAGTLERFEWLEKEEPQNASLYRKCREAYTRMMMLRTQSGIRNKDSGRYLDLDSMETAELRELRAILKAIKPIKSLLEVRFQVAGMR